MGFWGVLGGVGGCELAILLCSVDELFPRRAADSIPVEEGRGDPDDLLASSPRGLGSGIENDTVSSTLSFYFTNLS